jgi:Domain of unknown function (DUF4349)
MNKIFPVGILLLLLLGCQPREDKSSLHPEIASEANYKDAAAPASSPDLVVRKLIKDGSLSIEVSNTKDAREQIVQLVGKGKGYISAESQNSYDSRLQFSITARIPAERFDELVTDIEKLARRVEAKNIQVQDVTAEFIDVEARLKTKRELETRYREILKQAKSVEEILSIETQIANVRSEIESFEGRLKYLSDQVSFSTLNLSYYETIGTDFGFASKFVDGLSSGWKNLLWFFLALTNLWPFVFIALGVFYWLWRRRKS